jgi:hypothetical protein
MNDWDKDNLYFLLTTSSEVFEDWLSQADEDDIAYAIELLQQAKTELILERTELLDEVLDISAAQNVLQKFRNN